jgi:probable HAF family extracellular repeat protein
MKSMAWKCLTGLTLLAALASPMRFAAQDRQEEHKKQTYYVVKDLGTLGGTNATAEVISNKGWAVGTSDLPGDTAQHGFLWRDGEMIDLGTLGGPNATEFNLDLSDNSKHVIGTAETSNADPLGEDCFGAFADGLICRGFLWNEGNRTPLPTLGGDNSAAVAVNDRGQVVGFAENSVHDSTCVSPQVLDYEPVTWEQVQDGEIHARELPRIPGDTDGWAVAINDRGQVVGFTSDCAQSYGHAVIWQHGTVTDMGNLGGSFNSPIFVNTTGEVVGQANLPGDQTLTSFLWREDSVMTDLGMLPGDVWSSAFAITDQGKVVLGTSCSQVNFTNCRGYIWQEGVMTDLNSLVKPGSTPLYVVFGNDINSRGEIATYAFNQNTGAYRAAVMIPCDEQHAGTEACNDDFESSAAANQRPHVNLPENVRKRLALRLGFGRFGLGR